VVECLSGGYPVVARLQVYSGKQTLTGQYPYSEWKNKIHQKSHSFNIVCDYFNKWIESVYLGLSPDHLRTIENIVTLNQ